jgi:hypothetical protein
MICWDTNDSGKVRGRREREGERGREREGEGGRLKLSIRIQRILKN